MWQPGSLQREDPVQTDIGHPRHSEGVREANLSAVFVLLLTLTIMMTGIVPGVPAVIESLFVVISTVAAWFGMRRLFATRAENARQKAEADYRSNIEAETRRGLAEMRAKEKTSARR